MEKIKNKTFVENIVYNYLMSYADGEDLIQEGYQLTLENYEFRMFKQIYEKSGLKPNQETRGLIEKIFVETGKNKFLDLLVDFE